MKFLRKLLPPKHRHSFVRGRVRETNVVQTLGAGLMTYVTHKCSGCGEFYQVKYRGVRSPEDFD